MKGTQPPGEAKQRRHRAVPYSIIIPVRNGEATLARALRSCFEQKYTDLEVVVVDNGSTDATPTVAESFDDPRLLYVRTEEVGRSAARNVGLQLSSGRYVVFLDADDELGRDMLSNANELFHHRPDLDAVQCSTAYVRGGVIERRLEAFDGDLHLGLQSRNWIPINSMVTRAELCARWEVGMEHCEDWLFWLQTLEGASIARSRSDDAIVHLHDNQTTRDIATMRAFQLLVYLEHTSARGLTLADRARRTILILNDLTIYLGARRIPVIDAAIRRSLVASLAARVFGLGPVRRFTRALLRRRFRY